MRSTTFLSLLSVAALTSALPLENVESPSRGIVGRADHGKRNAEKWGADATATPAAENQWAPQFGAQAWHAPASSADPWAPEPITTGSEAEPAGDEGNDGDAAPTSAAAGAQKTGSSTNEGSDSGSSGGSAGSGAYKMLTGNGDNWPKMSDWVGNFEKMFELNKDLMGKSCDQFGTKNNTPEEIANIKASILKQAKAAAVDPRFVLAIVMQETKGCSRVPTTNNGVSNPGIMQSHAGVSCTTDNCSASIIDNMIKDGTSGTSSGDGLKQCLAQATGKNAIKVYEAARIYNSGSYKGVDLSDANGATKCYASDVANRLCGWTGADGEGCKN
ncbi:hypothetical protein BJ878DRAFT_441081 [Calycina marina]|uniref:Transglycosylase SLT domain-containing protein n=1 Tax=Calycina marina TaxID=1763456 RepID=A0A9P7Z3F0_9HELO|nr:hypothetical protein BJ878DRAFT_441081 [Calycina marina]